MFLHTCVRNTHPSENTRTSTRALVPHCFRMKTGEGTGVFGLAAQDHQQRTFGQAALMRDATKDQPDRPLRGIKSKQTDSERG